MRHRALLLLLLLVASATTLRAQSTGCASNLTRNAQGQLVPVNPFSRGAVQQNYPITLRPLDGSTLPAGVVAGINQAASNWKDGCPPADNPYMPDFPVINSDRPTDPEFAELTARVIFKVGEAPPPTSNGVELASWNDGGTLTLYERCPTTNLIGGNPCVDVPDPSRPGKTMKVIDYSDPRAQAWITHELGHAMGLGHDIETGSCKNVRGLMRASNQSSIILAEHCTLANQQGCDPAHPGATCPQGPFRLAGNVSGLFNGESISIIAHGTVNGAPVQATAYASFFSQEFTTDAVFPTGTTISINVTGPHAEKQCTASSNGAVIGNGNASVSISCECLFQTGTDYCFPDGEDPTEVYIDRQPGGCAFCWFDDPWWTEWPDFWGPPTGSGDCQHETVCTSRGMRCDEDYDGDGQYDCTEEFDCVDQCTSNASGLLLAGPVVGVSSPRPNDAGNGSLQFSGFAFDAQGVHSKAFYIDKVPVTPTELQEGIHRPGACASGCNTGFSGRINISNLAPGPHLFSVMAVDGNGDYKIPTIREIPFTVVAACGDGVLPVATLTAPQGGSIVSGQVGLSAIATDNVRVTKTEFFVDGALLANDTSAPYFANWNTDTLANGNHTLEVRAHDLCGNVGTSGVVTVEVRNSAERPPKARNDRARTFVGTAVTIDVVANDSDPDNDTIALPNDAIARAPQHGAAVRVSATSIRYTPVASFTGNDAFEYFLVDSTGRRDRAWVTVEVSGANEKPVANDDTATTNANSNVTINVTANDSDPDGDIVSLILSPFVTLPAHGYVERLSPSTVAYTPYPSYSGTDRFEYEIGDGRGRRDRAWVTVTVRDPNRAPVANNDAVTTGSSVPISIDVTANDTDPDGDSVQLIASPIITAPANGTATRVSPTRISYVSRSGFTGNDTFQYEIGDGNGRRARAWVTVTVTNTNHPPQAFDDDATTAAATAVSVDVTANDVDVDGDSVTLIANPIITAPANGTAVKISGSTITYTPRTGFSGVDRFQYEIGDGHAARSRAWVTITISTTVANRNPVAINDTATTRPATAVNINVTANDSDPDGDTVVLIASPIIVAPTSGTAAKLNVNSITYTPAAGFVGLDRFQYEIADGRGKRARGWVSVTVTDANNRPVAVDDVAFVQSGTNVSIEVTRNDWDPDADPVSLINAPIIVAPAHGTAERVNGHRIRYTSTAGYVGADRFQYEIGDGRGSRSRAWVNVTVSNGSFAGVEVFANNAPIAANDNVVGPADEPLAISVLVNDADAESDRIALADPAIVTIAQFGLVRRTADGVLTYFPSEGFRGNDAFEYEIRDANGAPARAWVSVQIPGTNHPPVAVNDAIEVAMNHSVTFDALANDSDADNDAIILGAVEVVRPPQHGTTRRTSDRQITYTPAANFFGNDSFVYEITDDRGGTAQASVIVTVFNQSILPNAVDDAYTVDAGATATFDVLANDTDPDGDPLRVVSSTQPLHGTLTWDESGARATYLAHAGFSGADEFTYTVSDPLELEDTATVRITVRAVRRPPVAANDTAETKTRTPVLIGVLANDYDPDWNRLTVKSVTQPGRGSVVINRSESVTFTPGNEFAGVATFTYVVADDTGLETTATVTVTVLNGAPTPRAEILSAPEDTGVGFQSHHLIGNDTDPDGDELHIVSIEPAQHGTILVASDKSGFSYRSKLDWTGMDTFYYTVSDPFGASVRVMSQIMVSAVNDSPVAVSDSVTTWNNQPLTIPAAQLLANDTDVEGHSLRLYRVEPAANGTVTLQPDGSVLYNPYGGFVGNDSFVYWIEDQGLAYGSGTVTVAVRQDRPPVASFTVTCTGRTCVFDASASTDDRGIVTYQWLLGNGAAAGGRTFTYTYPNPGMFTVRLTIEDVLGQRNATTRLATPTEPPPNAIDDRFTFTKGYSRWVAYADMLRNDTDPNNDVLTVASTNAALTDGTLTCDTTGCLFAPPSSYWWGVTTFTYTVSDGHGGTDTATVTIEYR